MPDQTVSQILASRILAAAVTECLPGAMIAAVEEARGGYYCDFVFSHPFSSEILIQLEERIRQKIREKCEVRHMELVPYSASEWLKQVGQLERAAQVLSIQGKYANLVQIGSFVDWCESPCGRHTGEAGILRLLSREKIGKDRYRIFGIAAVSKEELRSKMERLKSFPEKDHEPRGMVRSYWDIIDGERVWLANGLSVRRELTEFWRRKISTIAQEVEGDKSKWKIIAEKMGHVPVMSIERLPGDGQGLRGLLDADHSLALQVNSFGDSMEDCISFLQIVQQSLTILGFTFHIRFIGKKKNAGVLEGALQHLAWEADSERGNSEPRLEFLVQDALQCEWVVASVQEFRQKKFLQFTVWIERNLALLLEKDGEMNIISQQVIN